MEENRMKKLSLLSVCVLMVLACVAFAQDPGMPDSVIVGNLDGSPIHVIPGETLRVPIYFKNDEDLESTYFITGIAKNLGYPPGRMDYFGDYSSYWHWWVPHYDDPVYPDYFVFEQYGVFGGHIGDTYLNTDSSWQLIETMWVFIFADSLTPGDTSCMIASWPGISAEAGCIIMSSAQDIKENTPSRSIEVMNIYPNPFNAKTMLEYTLSEPSDVTIQIYDLTGRQIEMLHDGFELAGRHSIIWNTSDRSSGIYFCRISAGGYSETQRMVLLK
jgi:hypothetical protein